METWKNWETWRVRQSDSYRFYSVQSKCAWLFGAKWCSFVESAMVCIKSGGWGFRL